MKLNKLTENTIALILVQVVNLILPLLAIPYLARVLGAEKLGHMVFAISIAQILIVLTDFGFNLSAPKDIALHKDNIDKIYQIWSSVMVIKLIFSSLGFILVVLAGFLFDITHDNFLLYIIAYIAVIGNLIYPQWLFQGLEQLKYASFIQIACRVLVFVLLLVLVKNEADIYWAIFLQSVGGLLAGIVLIPALIKILSPATNKKIPTGVAIISYMKGSWVMFIPNIFGNLYLSCNTFFLGLLISPALVANYYVAEKMIRAAISLCYPISTAIFPQQVRNFSSSKDQALKSTMQITYLLLSLFFLGSIITYLFAEYFIIIFFGQEFIQAGYLLKLFSPLPILVMLSIIFSNLVMIPAGLEKTFSKIIMYSSIVNVVIFITLVYYLSNIGAVLANIFVELVICFSMFIVLKKSGNNPFIYWYSALNPLLMRIFK